MTYASNNDFNNCSLFLISKLQDFPDTTTITCIEFDIDSKQLIKKLETLPINQLSLEWTRGAVTR